MSPCTMVLKLDGYSNIVAHVWRGFGYFIYLFGSSLSVKTYFPSFCANRLELPSYLSTMWCTEVFLEASTIIKIISDKLN